jgi:1-acyl-sn-glycerol-3-phosphate acyltransferase
MAMDLRGEKAAETSGSIDASFERDYGFDSLTRMELMHRAEREFGATLSERALAEIETPRDLLREIDAAAGQPPAIYTPSAAAGERPVESGARAALGIKTLTEALAWHARHHPNKLHVRFYADETDGDTLTYGELWDDAGRVAAGLIAHDVTPGEAVVIMLPSGRDYFASFFGVLRAGCVPVPVYPPGRPREIEDHIRRHAKIAGNAQARIMITLPEARPFSRILAAQVENLVGIVTVEELKEAPRPNVWPEAKPEQVAFIQYTSGSTGDPKGVVLTHANLVANINAMATMLNVQDDDVFVSWLPLYHDMGLIGAWLGSLVHGIPLVLMSPLAFLARPRRWLDAITRYRGTISGAPNFAYEACAARIPDTELAGLDLSSWRVAFNGAEPVSPATIDAFTERFAPFGFRASAMMPVYGLAENSVGLAFPPIGRGPRIDWIERDAFLKSGRAVPGEPGASTSKAVPACGLPIVGHEIRIVDDHGTELPDRREGMIQFKGPSATSGYLRNPEANAALLAGEWRNSGDLGYTVAGEVHVTGRRKDMIIRAGRNIFPAELETAIGALDGISQGAVAVFGSPDPTNGTERLVVLAESRRAGTSAETKLQRTISDLAIGLIGLPPDVVRLVPPRTVPKTSSGKIRRQAARAVFESGASGPVGVRMQVARMAFAAVGPLIRRGARRIGRAIYSLYVTALGLAIAGIGWIAAVVLPVESWRWRALGLLFRFYMPLAGIRLNVRGLDKIPHKRGFVIAANHSSYLDAPVALSALPGRYSFVAKGELQSHWFSRVFLSRLKTIFVARFDARIGVGDADRMAQTVRDGRPVVSFPEGTISRMAGLLPFRLGIFMVAVRTHTPIVPLVIRGTRHVLRDGTWVPRPGPIDVELLDPIEPPADQEEWQAAVTMRDATRAAILARTGEPDLVHERVLDRMADEARGKEVG